MKFEIVPSELCSASTLGALLGLLAHRSSVRWIALGRDAYLAHYAQSFDRRISHPPQLIPMIVVSILLAFAALALLKGSRLYTREPSLSFHEKTGKPRHPSETKFNGLVLAL